MKILMLSEPGSAHTIKWVRALDARGLHIILFSIFPYEGHDYEVCKNVELYSANLRSDLYYQAEGSFKKLLFLKALPLLKRLLKIHQPDILHAHYLTSYGLLGALSRYHPFIVSVWGNDIYVFPRKSFIHKYMIIFTLARADMVLSTSRVMAEETHRYTKKQIVVTPFGIDLEKFRPVKSSAKESDLFIGIIKSLEKKYGIEYLLEAYRIIKVKYPEIKLKLMIVGGGSEETFLKQLAADLNIDKDTLFTGKIEYDRVPEYHNRLSIAVYPSIEDSESFGVSVLEAGACETPVVVSNVGGLPEVVKDGETGIVVEPRNAEKLAKALEILLKDEELRNRMGKNGRERVRKHYDINNNVDRMIELYEKCLNKMY